MVEPADVGIQELDTFSLLLPLPCRLTTVLVAGVWCWGINLHLRPSGSDTIPARTDPLSYLSVYRFASAFTAPLTVSVLFWTLIHGGGETHNVNYDILPNTTFLLIPRFFYRKNVWPSSGRSRLFSILRVSMDGVAKSENGKFGEVLLPGCFDVIYIALSMTWNGQYTSGRIDRSSTKAVPLLFAYATAFSAIALSTLMRAEDERLSQGLYYAVIAVVLFLCFAWPLKLLNLPRILEIFKRFVWVFLRAKTEWARTHHSTDVLLSDMGPKLDEY
ncbi:hypothetical protein M433DRAFT_148077 [Acidomyces richmondensis BFW]|nr:hypothetical protein M433DRAFT_148077 [Acidomyces richmondensis BFW]